MSTINSGAPSPRPSRPPEAWPRLRRLARIAGRPLERFLQVEAASGILLLASAAIALLWANSPWSESYVHLWHTPHGVNIGAFSFERTLEWFVNDALMVLFFFVVGLEIRREIHRGELSDWRRASLPVVAAVGGMLVPAGLYLWVASAPVTRSGWGVPMATDIAFAVGILTLLGKRVPPALRVLLLALAVIDDLGAILVIALFYSSGINGLGLLVAALGILGIFALQRFGVRARLAYVAPSFVAWAGVYAAGIHPTIAGVVIGLITPLRAALGAEGVVGASVARREATSPAESLIHDLHPWVAFAIMPIFALANAGVVVSGRALEPDMWLVSGGVVLGLVVGKPLGILLASWLTLRLRISALPAGLTWAHLLVLGLVAGVGFTMALFVAQLAFTDPTLLAAAKLGVLAASAAAAVLGLSLGRVLLTPRQAPGAAQTADEAESSTEK